MAVAGFLPAAILGVLVIAAAGYDLAVRRIPNWLCGLVLLAGIAVALAAFPAALPGQLGHMALALAVGMGLFALGWIGGGDAKLYAAVAVWFPLALAPWLAVAISLSGGLLLVLFFAVRRFSGSSRKPQGLPYGVAIAAGAMLTLTLARPQ